MAAERKRVLKPRKETATKALPSDEQLLRRLGQLRVRCPVCREARTRKECRLQGFRGLG